VLEHFQDCQDEVGAGSQDSESVLAALSKGSIHTCETQPIDYIVGESEWDLLRYPQSSTLSYQ
jgi:hypothetical protein